MFFLGKKPVLLIETKNTYSVSCIFFPVEIQSFSCYLFKHFCLPVTQIYAWEFGFKFPFENEVLRTK